MGADRAIGKRTKERQQAIPSQNCLTLALQAGVGPEILINLNLDSTVLRSTLSGRIRSDRFGFAESLTRDSAAFHTLLHYIVPNRRPTPIRQLQIVSLRPDAVRETR